MGNRFRDVGTPYDLGSIMQYSAYAFAKGSLPVFTKPDGSPISVTRGDTFSKFDIEEINSVYTCECNLGFFLNGADCTDINECENGQNDCDSNAVCTNIPGSFSCVCNNGYVGDGKTCDDINECIIGAHHCDSNANCRNNIGSFTCDCHIGYHGDGFTCTDIDECSNGDSLCSANASCTNTVGSYECECNTGYVGNGFNCLEGMSRIFRKIKTISRDLLTQKLTLNRVPEQKFFLGVWNHYAPFV